MKKERVCLKDIQNAQFKDIKRTLKLSVANKVCAERDKEVRVIRRGFMFYSGIIGSFL